MTAAPQISALATERLQIFVGLLAKWNAAINLVSPASLAEVWTRHVADSAQVLDAAPSRRARWLDMGSGAGFPGIVIALITADTPNPVEMTLVESDRRKAAFLSTVSRETGVPMIIQAARIEAVAPQNADTVSARALAPLVRLCSFAERHLAPHGAALFLKGGHYDAEIAEARRTWSFALDVRRSSTDPAGVVLIMKDLRRV
jgi:16S rRNA (guanine527-N7)-methyltransferase